MNVLLINPGQISKFGFDCFGKEDYQTSWVNHGLGMISACAKKEGFNVLLLDLRKCLSWKDVAGKIKSFQPAVAGISMTSIDYNPAMKSIEIVRNMDSGIKVVVGGIHPTVALDELKENEKIDYIIQGEGELSFVELLRRLDKGEKPERIIRGRKPLNLDELPFVDREAFDYENGELTHPFRGLGVFEQPFVTMIAGRGCPYHCNFCQPAERQVFGPKVTMRGVDNFIGELKLLREKYRFRSLMIHDDCLTAYPAWGMEFCDKYAGNGFNQPFFAQGRADHICRHEDLIKRLSQVGLKYLSIGLESGSQRMLDFLKKGTTVEQNIQAGEICRKYDIKVGGNFMLGIPTETKEDVMLTIEIIKKIKPYSWGITHFTPYPGSGLYQYCKDNNLILIKNHDQYYRDRYSGAKIRGIDYRFLRKAEMLVYSESWFARLLARPVFQSILKNRLVRGTNRWMERFEFFRKWKEGMLK